MNRVVLHPRDFPSPIEQFPPGSWSVWAFDRRFFMLHNVATSRLRALWIGMSRWSWGTEDTGILSQYQPLVDIATNLSLHKLSGATHQETFEFE